MLKLIKAGYRRLALIRVRYRWYKGYREVKRKYLSMLAAHQSPTKLLSVADLGNTLIIIPHADDDLIGCYSVIKRSKSVYAYYIGEYPIKDRALTDKRHRELRAFAGDFDLKIVEKKYSDHIRNIQEAIEIHGINSILTPDCLDWHSDHQQASFYLMEALLASNASPAIFTYSVTVPHGIECPVYLCRMTKSEQAEKWDMFNRYYVSQRFMPVLRFKLQERLDAVRWPGAYAAETFRPLSLAQLQSAYQNRPEHERRDELLKAINDIRKIRSYSDSYFNENSL